MTSKNHYVAAAVAACIVCMASQAQSYKIKDPLEYFLLEELPANTPIGNIAIDSRLEDKHGKQIFKTLRYHFVSNTYLTQFFTIDERTAIIKTTKKIDRDTVCGHNKTCVTRADVLVGPQEYAQTIRATIEIVDINDNKPEFAQKSIAFQVSETISPGYSVTIPAAVDSDSDSNAVQQYELVSSSTKFQLKEAKKSDGNTDVRLVLKESLDREHDDFYSLKIVAHDGGNPSQSGSVLVNITVLDSNDNDPKFENSTYEVYVSETTRVHSTIARVVAKDADAGLNGEIVYRFSRHTRNSYGKVFGINTDTGDIFVTGPLDYEKGFIYLLQVIADDKGMGSVPSQATVVVRIRDSNDNPPTITINSGTAGKEVTILESAKPGAYLAHFSVVDKDSGMNGRLDCNVNDTHFRLQKLYPTEYKIVTVTSMDRETKAFYDIAIRCADGGHPPRVSLKYIQVRVLDENDNSPVFVRPMYTIYGKENNNVGEFVLQVNATDRDADKNAEIRYAMHRDARQMFKIDPVTGRISANVMFDYEETRLVSVHVIATDKGNPPRSTITTLQVHIVDTNDENAVFSQDSYTFHVSENQVVGTAVGQVSATDRDSPPFNEFSYYFKREQADAAAFAIDPKNGRITTKKVLDRESQSVYYMIVLSSNDGVQYMTSSATVTIHITDKNDHYPVIDFPVPKNDTVTISNLVPVGLTFSRIQAHDLDIELNGKLEYFKENIENHDMFVINSQTGAVSLLQSVSNKRFATYHFHFRVQDNGSPKRVAKGILKVIVNESIVFIPPMDRYVNSRDQAIVISVALTVFMICLLVLVAVLFIRRRDKMRRNNSKCSRESQKMLFRMVAGNEQMPPDTRDPRPMVVDAMASEGNAVVQSSVRDVGSVDNLLNQALARTSENQHSFQSQKALADPSDDVTCGKGYFTKMSSTPYEEQDCDPSFTSGIQAEHYPSNVCNGAGDIQTAGGVQSTGSCDSELQCKDIFSVEKNVSQKHLTPDYKVYRTQTDHRKNLYTAC